MAKLNWIKKVELKIETNIKKNCALKNFPPPGELKGAGLYALLLLHMVK
jgi:hypothetical protein